MKFGIIGYQHFHIDHFIRTMILEGHEFCGVYDDNPESSQKCSATYKVPALSRKEHLLDSRIKVLGTGDIPSKRIEALEWAAGNGIHLVSDKALVIDEHGLRILQRIASEKAIEIGMILDFRYSGLVNKLKEVINEGALGDLTNLVFMTPHKLKPESRPEWFWDRETAGSIITDLMIHSVDLFMWFNCTQDVFPVSCLTGRKSGGLPDGFKDYASAVLRTKDDVSGSIYVDWLVSDNYYTWSDARIFCHGTEGFAELRFTGDSRNKEPLLIINMKNKPEPLLFQKLEPAINIAKDITNRINGDGKPLLTSSDVLACSRMCVQMELEASNRAHGKES